MGKRRESITSNQMGTIPGKKYVKRKKKVLCDKQTEVEVDFKEKLLSEMREIGCDGTNFCKSLEASIEDRLKKRGKPPRIVRYFHYCGWAHALLSKNVGPKDAEYAFPPSVLSFIRSICPGNVKGEIREDAYPVTLEEFCRALKMK